MKHRTHLRYLNWLMLFLISLLLPACAGPGPADWPRAESQNRPWSRWWWMGSAVDEENLTDQLTQYQQAGLGGLEICPIYGVKGHEDEFVDFLSPRWIELLQHTMTESKRLGLGIDLTGGTGWPFGGPMVSRRMASSGVILKRYSLTDGKLTELLPTKGMLQYLVAVSSDGRRVDVTDKAVGAVLNWTAPPGSWMLYVVAVKDGVQKVKRSAPGGEGYVLDPYSAKAMDAYLSVFDEAFGDDTPMPRSFFHDSFEYYHADWTTNFFHEFQTRRGYDLRDHIEAFFGEGPEETIARLMCDYHKTINDLHIEYLRHWNTWCRSKGSLTRNQAHGAPGNLVDIYAVSDIPETEIFRHVDEAQIPMMKLSSSSAHLKGNTLASAESFTWLKEHYQASLADLKNATDFLFLSGVNHIFFHGIPYSPKQAPWPGWQFYASVNFGPGGGLWHGLPDYNAYVTRCQSILQSGRADNDILLYLPIYDFWQKKGNRHMTFTIHNQDDWLYPSAFYNTAMQLWKKGYTYDTVTDDFLRQAVCRDGGVQINGVAYDVIIIPRCDLMPVATLQKLLDLARQGAVLLFQDKIPTDVPGLANLKTRQNDLKKLLEQIAPAQTNQPSPLAPGQLQPAFLEKQLAQGKVVSADLETLLRQTAIPREPAMQAGLRFVRRRSDAGYDYFFVNRSEKTFDGWLALGKLARSAVIMDPLSADRTGWAMLRQQDDAAQVYLQLQPGRSLIVRTFSAAQKISETSQWHYTQTEDRPVTIEGTWSVEFIEGGPELPQDYQTTALTSWTECGDNEARRFFGMARYTITFDAPEKKADSWLLDLGCVCETARVTLNGQHIGALWARPFRLELPQDLKAKDNRLEIEVTNLAANRIRDLDQRGVNWKYFYDINVVNVNYKPFDASGWPLTDSGLLGPVRLYPQRRIDPASITSPTLAAKPTLYIIGDSTVHNSTRGLRGWGDCLKDNFDSEKINVFNYARGGRSSRTFQTEGLWQKVLDQLVPGDYVLMQFGHNDGGPLETGRARGTLKGVGDQTQDVILEATGQPETVHTYGWYMKKYIAETQAKGAIPIVVSPVPRNRWDKENHVIRASLDYGRWARQVAESQQAFFINLNEAVAVEYEKRGPETVAAEFFADDHTHTTPQGAKLNAEILTIAIEQASDCMLAESLAVESPKDSTN